MANPQSVATFARQIAGRLEVLAPKLRQRWALPAFWNTSIATRRWQALVPDGMVHRAKLLRSNADLLVKAISLVGAQHTTVQSYAQGFQNHLSVLSTIVAAGEGLAAAKSTYTTSDVAVAEQLLGLAEYSAGQLKPLITGASVGASVARPTTDTTGGGAAAPAPAQPPLRVAPGSSSTTSAASAPSDVAPAAPAASSAGKAVVVVVAGGFLAFALLGGK